MTDRDARKLVGCHAALIRAVDVVLRSMAESGHPMMVTDGARTLDEQKALYAQGRTTPGHIVTYSSGLAGHESNHQSGRAADCCFVVNQLPSWAEDLPWEDYAEAALAAGLEAGFYWKRQDKPHVQINVTAVGVLNA